MPPDGLSGDPDTWVSYTTGDRDPTNLIDHRDGTYSYVFATDLYDLYVESNRHRLLLMVTGDIVEQAKNVTYDFVPEQLPSPFVFDLSRDIVTTSACNDCHGSLGSELGSASFHDGGRYTAEGCATCHTTTLGEGAAEFGPMIHEIHTAQNIEGLQDFSEVTYPQDPRNCTTCHAGPDGSNWKTRPSMTGCQSCHSDIDFVTGAGHAGGLQFNNANCSFCHTPMDIEVAHRTENATEHDIDSTSNDPIGPPPSDNRYPAYIEGQAFVTHDVNVRTTLRLPYAVNLVLRYDYLDSTIDTEAEFLSGEVSADTRSHILGATVTWNPVNWWWTRTGVNYVHSTIDTAADDYDTPVAGFLHTFDNDYVMANFASGVAIDANTDAEFLYTWTSADNYHDVSASSVAYGSRFEEHGVRVQVARRLDDHTRIAMGYGFFDNDEAFAGGQYNYSAHILTTSFEFEY